MAPAWHDRRAWCVLDTGFGTGEDFIGIWKRWQRDSQRPRMLHYVALAECAPDAGSLIAALRVEPVLAGRADALDAQMFGLLPGLHRIVLHDGHLLLTLCIGPRFELLRELRLSADEVLLNPAADANAAWSRWQLKALARLCRHDARVATHQGSPFANAGDLLTAGFVPNTAAQGWRYAPHWQLRHPRVAPRHQNAREPGTCVVVGAGMAGACVAASLARRGWQVTVLDQAEAPARGASGLPVGLLAPAVSRDDAPRSRIVRAGMRLTLESCRTLLTRGSDWASCGARETVPDAARALPIDASGAGVDWSRPDDATHLWHPRAAWVKPAAWIRALLAQPGIRFEGGHELARLARSNDDRWALHDADGCLLAEADQVVLACANGALRIVNASCAPAHALTDTQPVAGSLCWGPHKADDDAQLPQHALRGNGHLLAHVAATDGGHLWCAGATFENPDSAEPARPAREQIFSKLEGLAPLVARQLAARFSAPDGHVRVWSGVRCTTPDRLPLVGEAAPTALPGVWLCAGMGSRGLALATLCAELLAAQLGAEPLPIEVSLADALLAERMRMSSRGRRGRVEERSRTGGL